MNSLLRKAVCLCLLICSISAVSFAQFFASHKIKDVEKLISQKVAVMYNDPGPFSDRVKAAFKNYWTVSPYTFGFGDKNGPVFGPEVIMALNSAGGSNGSVPYFVYGRSESYGSVEPDQVLAYFPINALFFEFDARAKNVFKGSLLRIPYIVYNLNDMLTRLKTNGSTKGYEKYLEEKSSRIAGKTLLIPKELTQKWDINPNAEAFFRGSMSAANKKMKEFLITPLPESILSDYAGKYKVMAAEEIMALEDSADAGNYALFMSSIDQGRVIQVFDLKTKELLYIDKTKTITSQEVKGKDFKKISKAAGL